MKILKCIALSFFALTCTSVCAMDQAEMENIVKTIATESKGENGFVEFNYKGMWLYLISDVNHDRMRIISPISEYIKLSQGEINKAMESNFHSALDARYAVSKGVLYAAYIHPLSKLDKAQIESAVTQVFNLRATFGNEYSSGVLNFQQ